MERAANNYYPWRRKAFASRRGLQDHLSPLSGLAGYACPCSRLLGMSLFCICSALFDVLLLLLFDCAWVLFHLDARWCGMSFTSLTDVICISFIAGDLHLGVYESKGEEVSQRSSHHRVLGEDKPFRMEDE